MRSVICHPPGKTNDEVLQLMLVGANESFAGGEPVEVAPPQSIVTWFAKAAPANNSPPANRTKTFFIIRVSFILLRIYLKYCVTAVSGCSVFLLRHRAPVTHAMGAALLHHTILRSFE